MITKVVIENFKRFSQQEFTLSESIVLAGPNNAGKSTLLQALATWSMTLERWRLGKGHVIADKAGKPKPRTAKMRTGQPVTRKDFTAIPLREFNLLWNQTLTALSKAELGPDQKPGEPRLIHITVSGSQGLTQAEPWSLTMELRYQSTELIYVKPVELGETDIPQQALALSIVHCPPFSGIGAEEKRMDRGAQNLEIGRGKSGDILRNLLLEVSHHKENWDALVADIQELFSVTLQPPEYSEALPFILCEYLGGIPAEGRGKGGFPQFDIASGGSGFHQVLLLLSFFYARPATVFLLDEPDAHLHVILQRQIYDRLRAVASRRDCQLIIATHSEVILDSTPPVRVVSFLGKPHPLVRADQRDQVREAMSRLTTLDLLLAEQGRAVLYCEGESDFDILRAWSQVLNHPAKRFFSKPFFHVNEGRNPREAKGHLFAVHAIHPSIRGLLLLDGDNRSLPDRELSADGLLIVRWHRYEIENYLVVPAAIRRTLSPEPADLFTAPVASKAIDYLKTQLPPAFFTNPLADSAAIVSVPASKELLPQMFEAAGRPLEKGDFFLIAQNMRPEEIHPEVVRVLDAISQLLPDDDLETA
jgi:predicted ATPase